MSGVSSASRKSRTENLSCQVPIAAPAIRGAGCWRRRFVEVDDGYATGEEAAIYEHLPILRPLAFWRRRLAATETRSAAKQAPRPVGLRIAAAVLLATMAVGSLGLWTVVPIGGLWFAAAVTTSRAGVYVAALFACPTAMLVWGAALSRMNQLYVRLLRRSGGEAESPLDTLLVGSFVFAVLAFLAWYFLLSGSPTSTPWPDEFSGQ